MNRKNRTQYWVFTSLFALQMGFTAYAQLRLPQAQQMVAHLGFPDYFRVELCWLKLIGVAVLVLPQAPPRLKEWAYAGFTIVLGSALFAHLSVGDAPAAWIWSVATFVLGALSYVFHRRLLSAERAPRRISVASHGDPLEADGL